MDRATMKQLGILIAALVVAAVLILLLINYLAPVAAADLGPDQDLAEAQARLTQLGYDTGYADGINGPATESALAAYQHDRCLVPTGTLDKKTWATLWHRKQRGCSLYAEPTGAVVDLKCLDCKN